MDKLLKNNISGVGQLCDIAKNIRILLVDHDISSLMLLAFRFQQQSYQVITTHSASVGLSLIRDHSDCFSVVIADRHMPEMDIYEFVHELHNLREGLPIMLIDENRTEDSIKEAMDNRVCYIFSKPLGDFDIAHLWQNFFRVTGKMPSPMDIGNPSSGTSRNGDERNNRGSKRNLINAEDRQNLIRGKNQIAQDSNISVDTNIDDGCNSTRSRMNWTPELQQKFLQAIENVGGLDAKPMMVLREMNVPGLTRKHVGSHLQKHREKHSRNVQRSDGGPVMPSVQLPAAPVIHFGQGQTYGPTANVNYMEAGGVPQNGTGRVEMAQDQNETFWANTAREQAQVFPARFGLGTLEGGPQILPSGGHDFQGSYHEPAGGATHDNFGKGTTYKPFMDLLTEDINITDEMINDFQNF